MSFETKVLLAFYAFAAMLTGVFGAFVVTVHGGSYWWVIAYAAVGFAIAAAPAAIRVIGERL